MVQRKDIYSTIKWHSYARTGYHFIAFKTEKNSLSGMRFNLVSYFIYHMINFKYP